MLHEPVLLVVFTRLFNNCLGSQGRTISYDTGHFAFETRAMEIGQEILAFLKGHL
jgi:hypothetical protein